MLFFAKHHRILSAPISGLLLLALLSGCAHNRTADGVVLWKTGQVDAVHFGQLVSIEPAALAVPPPGDLSWLGAFLGIWAGASAGIGGITDLLIPAATGGAGFFLGHQVELKMAEQPASRLVVALENGEHIAVVRKSKDVRNLNIDDRVKVLRSGNTYRVVPVTPVVPAVAD